MYWRSQVSKSGEKRVFKYPHKLHNVVLRPLVERVNENCEEAVGVTHNDVREHPIADDSNLVRCLGGEVVKHVLANGRLLLQMSYHGHLERLFNF